MRQLDSFKPQELANVMWAFASMEHDDPALAAAVAQRVMSMAGAFNEQVRRSRGGGVRCSVCWAGAGGTW